MSTQTRVIPPRRVWIDDGRWVSIRPIERSDGPGLSDFYSRLSPESRRRRFLGSAPIPDPRLLGAFTGSGDGVVAVLSEPGPNDGAVVGHGAVLAERSVEAEVAFAVADALQGHGIGRALVEEALALASRRGIRRVTATLLAENAQMRRLLHASGCEIVTDEIDGGVEEITLEVPAAA